MAMRTAKRAVKALVKAPQYIEGLDVILDIAREAGASDRRLALHMPSDAAWAARVSFRFVGWDAALCVERALQHAGFTVEGAGIDIAHGIRDISVTLPAADRHGRIIIRRKAERARKPKRAQKQRSQ